MALMDEGQLDDGVWTAFSRKISGKKAEAAGTSEVPSRPTEPWADKAMEETKAKRALAEEERALAEEERALAEEEQALEQQQEPVAATPEAPALGPNSDSDTPYRRETLPCVQTAPPPSLTHCFALRSCRR